VYAKYMDYYSQIFNVLGELCHLVRTIFTDGMHFISLSARSRTALAAENLFLRKQLTFYHERKVVPHNQGRPHSSIGPGITDPPAGLPVTLQEHRRRIPDYLKVVGHPVLGGLHHEYELVTKAA